MDILTSVRNGLEMFFLTVRNGSEMFQKCFRKVFDCLRIVSCTPAQCSHRILLALEQVCKDADHGVSTAWYEQNAIAASVCACLDIHTALAPKATYQSWPVLFLCGADVCTVRIRLAGIGTSVPQDIAPVTQYQHIAAVASFKSHTFLFHCHGAHGVLCGF